MAAGGLVALADAAGFTVTFLAVARERLAVGVFAATAALGATTFPADALGFFGLAAGSANVSPNSMPNTSASAESSSIRRLAGAFFALTEISATWLTRSPAST